MYHIDKTYFWIIFLTALGVTLLITPISILIAKKAGVMDIPKDERRVHNKPIPRMGGLGIYFGINTGYILAINLGLCDYAGVDDAELYGVFFGGTVMFIVGLIDDVRGMRPMVKLAGQIVSALIVFLAGVRVANIGGFIGGDITTFGGAVSLILTVIWIVAIANTINLIDGLDGLAAGVVAISTCCIAYVAYIHGNYHIACFTMLAMAGGFALIIPALTLSLPIFDTLFAILRRLVNHKPIMQPDKEHVHHRLLRAGMGQRRTVLCMYGITAVMGTAAVLLSRGLKVETTGLCVIAFAFIYIVMTDPSRKSPKTK